MRTKQKDYFQYMFNSPCKQMGELVSKMAATFLQVQNEQVEILSLQVVMNSFGESRNLGTIITNNRCGLF